MLFFAFPFVLIFLFLILSMVSRSSIYPLLKRAPSFERRLRVVCDRYYVANIYSSPPTYPLLSPLLLLLFICSASSSSPPAIGVNPGGWGSRPPDFGMWIVWGLREGVAKYYYIYI